MDVMYRPLGTQYKLVESTGYDKETTGLNSAAYATPHGYTTYNSRWQHV